MTTALWILLPSLGFVSGILVGLWIAQHRGARNLEQVREALHDSFSRLAQEALDRNAEQQRGTLQSSLQPVQDTLKQTRETLAEIEKKRDVTYALLAQQLQDSVIAQNRLREEIQSLAQALSRPEVRGTYGEITLRRLIELAGMVRHCDFVEQPRVGGQRPDVVVRMPENRVLPIDAKAPLQLYLDAYQEQDSQRKAEKLKAFATKMHQMVTDLSRKEYWSQFDNALDFVVMFVPGDQFLNAALEQRPELMEYALKNKVLLTTPSSLMAILRAVAYGWSQQQVAQNADQIRHLGEELYDRVSTFLEHMNKLGSNLRRSTDAFNQAVGSWQSRVQPSLSRFRELGIDRAEAEAPEELTQQPRSFTNVRPDSDP